VLAKLLYDQHFARGALSATTEKLSKVNMLKQGRLAKLIF